MSGNNGQRRIPDDAIEGVHDRRKKYMRDQGNHPAVSTGPLEEEDPADLMKPKRTAHHLAPLGSI